MSVGDMKYPLSSVKLLGMSKPSTIDAYRALANDALWCDFLVWERGTADVTVSRSRTYPDGGGCVITSAAVSPLLSI